MEEPAFGLMKSQNFLLQLLLALPTLAIQAPGGGSLRGRHRAPRALLSLPPHPVPGTALLVRVHQLPEDEHGTCQGALPTIIQMGPFHFSTLDSFSFLISSLVAVFAKPFLVP